MNDPCTYSHCPSYTIKWANLPREINAAYALRRRVFCTEQGLFKDDDRDDIDPKAQLLVALGLSEDGHESVIGTVRIHEAEPGIWYGSRLAVDVAFRSQGYIGSTLIKLAVSSAHALGCKQFLASVQAKNELLFQRLHWQRIGESHVLGHPHVTMQADLTRYPPCYQPYKGFVIANEHYSPNPEIRSLPL